MASSSSTPNFSRIHDEQPAFIYGTAWKKDQTKRLVKDALLAGFRRVDTAAQPRHYQEHLVGEALREAYSEGIVKRKDLHVSIGPCSYHSRLLIRNRCRQSTPRLRVKI